MGPNATTEGMVDATYIMLAFTMLLTSAIYLWKARERCHEKDEVHGLIVGIGLSFLGHGIDQTMWAFGVNLEITSVWVHTGWWFIVAAKWLAIFGACFHLRLALLAMFPRTRVMWVAGGLLTAWLLLVPLVSNPLPAGLYG